MAENGARGSARDGGGVIRIRGGRGLGDSIYLRPLVEHFIAAGKPVTALTDYPDVFLGTGAETEPFGRNNITVLGHYVNGKADPTTTQWQDVCKSAGVSVPLRFDWNVRNHALVDDVKARAGGDPIIIVHGGRVPMARTDKFGAELLPMREAFATVLDVFPDCFMVSIGKAEKLYPLHVDLDLNGSTSVTDLFDLTSICAGIIAQCSFAVPLAEAFDKPLLAVWAAHGMQSNMHPYVKSITPQKVLGKATSNFVVDDWPVAKIQEAARAFRQLL